ncbi:MAG TPA: imidazolonepropionase [Thermodesulfobacteriota bacterium]
MRTPSISADLVIDNTAEVVTLALGRPLPGVIPRGAVACREGRIVWVGPEAFLDESVTLAPGGRRLDARGGVVCPGFVDAHTHLLFAGSRLDEFERRTQGATYREIAAEGGGILSTVRATRHASLEALVAAGRPRLDLLLDLGTTTVEVKSGYGLDVGTELRMLQAIDRLSREHEIGVVATCLAAHEMPEEYRDRRDDFVALVRDELLPEVARLGLARFADVFCEQGVFTPEEARAILLRARDLGLGIRLHADEFADTGGAALAADLGAASADHLLFASDAGLDRMAEARVVMTALPTTALVLGVGRFARAREYLDRGGQVALATDWNPGTSMTPSLPLAATLACTQMGLTPAEALAAITRGGAASLGLAHEIGRIEGGLAADLVVLDLPDYRALPYFFGVNHVSAVVKAGRVVREGQATAGKALVP